MLLSPQRPIEDDVASYPMVSPYQPSYIDNPNRITRIQSRLCNLRNDYNPQPPQSVVYNNQLGSQIDGPRSNIQGFPQERLPPVGGYHQPTGLTAPHLVRSPVRTQVPGFASGHGPYGVSTSNSRYGLARCTSPSGLAPPVSPYGLTQSASPYGLDRLATSPPASPRESRFISNADHLAISDRLNQVTYRRNSAGNTETGFCQTEDANNSMRLAEMLHEASLAMRHDVHDSRLRIPYAPGFALSRDIPQNETIAGYPARDNQLNPDPMHLYGSVNQRTGGPGFVPSRPPSHTPLQPPSYFVSTQDRQQQDRENNWNCGIDESGSVIDTYDYQLIGSYLPGDDTFNSHDCQLIGSYLPGDDTFNTYDCQLIGTDTGTTSAEVTDRDRLFNPDGVARESGNNLKWVSENSVGVTENVEGELNL